MFDKVDEKWRVLKGYERTNDNFHVVFTDGTYLEIDHDYTNIFRNEISA